MRSDGRQEPVRFRDSADLERERAGVIYCCSEKSVYDPTRGARVLGGPAGQPLTTILLQHDPQAGALFAVGTAGGEMYERCFEKFGFRLALEHGTADVRRRARGSARVTTVDAYSATRISCSAEQVRRPVGDPVAPGGVNEALGQDPFLRR